MTTAPQYQIQYTPLSKLAEGETFQDEFGSVYSLTKNTSGNTEIKVRFAAGGPEKFLGYLLEDTYIKHEDEAHRYFKENAWTVNYPILQRVNHVYFKTDKREYFITREDALKSGRKLDLNAESKQVVPIKYWNVTGFNKLEQRRLDLFGVEWVDKLVNQLNQDYMKQLAVSVNDLRASGPVYPTNNQVFRAFKDVSYSDVKVVILGQDPYPQPYANGRAFAVEGNIALPYSLEQLKLEAARMYTDAGFLPEPFDPSLTNWTSQGVMLLNMVLTVGSKPGSHSTLGWQNFTIEVIKLLTQHSTPIVFMLWGAKAGEMSKYIDSTYHLVLNAPHPAASAYKDYRGAPFLGCDHFTRANEFLNKTYGKKITW